MPARCWPVAVVAAAALLFAPLASAQDKPKVESETINFETADGVELQGALYKPLMLGKDKGQVVMAAAVDKAPVVILLHPYLGDSKSKDWDGLAVALARAGFHVLRFDFRGHGSSTKVKSHFWDRQKYPENSEVFSAKAKQKPLPVKLELADLKAKPGYFPMLVNDIMAARVALDKLNDDGTLNTSSVYLIGAGDAATLGMMYMTAEWTRPQKPTEAQAKFITNLPINGLEPRDSAGRDIAGAIWLSPSKPSIASLVSDKAMQEWVTAFPDMRENNAVLSLYGDGDTAGKKMSNFITDEVLVAKPKKGGRLGDLKFTMAKPIEKNKNAGVKLLSDTATEAEILKYLGMLESDRKSVARLPNRNLYDPPYIQPAQFKVDVKK